VLLLLIVINNIIIIFINIIVGVALTSASFLHCATPSEFASLLGSVQTRGPVAPVLDFFLLHK
jgi:hypothetical protein